MRKTALAVTAILLLLTALAGWTALAEQAEEAEPAEWTVMFYFCGADLESKYSYATGNLQEISETYYSSILLPFMDEDETTIPPDWHSEQGEVNVLIQTGGSKKWHAQDLGMDISPKALQRWIYRRGLYDEFELMDTQPLQSMADPSTLSDFIRWGKATCPAKKYALVLWGHGDGARTGLFIDELFNQDMMRLYELKKALADADTHLETVIIDACLMANIETAWAIKDSASWLVASEENVPGKGSAISGWLQQLICNPWGDGEWLSRTVCDCNCIKYANDESEQSRSLLTWSVIDLSKVDALVENFQRYISLMCDALKNHPLLANLYMSCLYETPAFGDGRQNMRDLGSMLYNDSQILYADLPVRSDLLKALTDAVSYNVRGTGRSDARGLSFCYPADFDNDELDNYAKSFPAPVYLAYIDSLSPWTAPDWVYDVTERLPVIEDIDDFDVTVRKAMASNGMPGILISSGAVNVDSSYYSLYQLDEATGETVLLGKTSCAIEFLDDSETTIRYAGNPMHWPAIDGHLICMNMVQSQYNLRIYDVPVMIDNQTCILRCGRTIWDDDFLQRLDKYEIYGLWEGYNENSTVPNRGVKPLAMLSGMEYNLLYPIDGSQGNYVHSEPLTMYRALDVREIPLPAGTYYLEYEIADVFMRRTVLDRLEIQWDGENMTFPDADKWEDGKTINLNVPRD